MESVIHQVFVLKRFLSTEKDLMNLLLRWTQLFYAHGTDQKPTELITNRTHNVNHPDRGIFSWIWVTLKLNKEQILLHSGADAVGYLSFQQHLMFVMACITFISIVIILLVNCQGILIDHVNAFRHTTISNLPVNSSLLLQ